MNSKSETEPSDHVPVTVATETSPDRPGDPVSPEPQSCHDR